VIALIEALWSVIDVSSNPVVGADWFSGPGSTPFRLAMGIGAVMLALTVMAAVIRAVLAGSPGGIAKAVGRDLPMAVFTMIATIGFTDVALQLTNEISLWVWAGTRDDAKASLDTLAVLLRTGVPGSGFLAVALALLLLLAMVFLWVVLYVREALIYLVVVFSAAFAWPMMVFPPLRETAKKAFELLLALIICKPVITLALSVGVSAMASIDRNPTASTVGTLGTLVAGVIVFGMAAFMPYLVWKLMPLVAAAVVAQGVAAGPVRATQTGMQMQFYGRQLASGGKIPGRQAAATGSAGGGATGGGAAGGGAAGGGAAGGGAAAAGPAAAAVAAASLATSAVRNTVGNTAKAATSSGES